jgi:DNA gyrase inhibitor GyrI
MLDDGAIDGRDTIVVAKESKLVHFMIIAGGTWKLVPWQIIEANTTLVLPRIFSVWLPAIGQCDRQACISLRLKVSKMV